MPSKTLSTRSSAKPATTSKSTTRLTTPLQPLSVPYTPHAYQRKAIRYLVERGGAGLFLDPGLGKTSITLAALLILLKKKLVSKVLLVAPLRVCHSTWPNEIAKWADFKGITYTILHGPKKDERLNDDVNLYIINPEGLDWLLQPVKEKSGNKTKVTVDVRAFKALGFDCLVVDELTKFKNHTSIRWKALTKVLGTFARRWGLTGSPAANGLEQLFGQVYVLDEGRSLGRYVTHYRRMYFQPSWDGFGWQLRDGMEDAIYERISPVALRMAGEDYLELPSLVENVIPIELPEKARQVYQQLEDELVAKIAEGVVTAKNAGVASGKCRQVASGAIYLEAGLGQLLKPTKGQRDVAVVHEAKLDALEDIVEELQGSPLLVAYEFNHDLEALRRRFGADLPYIGHGVSVKRGKELEALWNAGKLPILAAHPASVAHGLNLQESGQHIAWYTLTWDYELYDQLIRRLLRQGSKHQRIFVHLLLGQDTVDEAVWGSIQGKRAGQDNLFRGLKALQKRR